MSSTNTPATLGLRIDVDTFFGTREGVPNILSLLDRYNIKASFFFSVGPANMGRHVYRLLKPRFLAKMLRTRANRLYGWQVLTEGTFWPGKLIGQNLSSIIRLTEMQGHEVGLHGWDHHQWQSQATTMSTERLGTLYRRGIDELRDILCRPVTCSAAPGWKANGRVLIEQNQVGLRFHSDCRGNRVFRPVVNGVRCTPQVPSTIPTYDEVIGRLGLDDSNYNAWLMSSIREKQLNVLTLHAEVEGLTRISLFEEFLAMACGAGLEFRPLGYLLPSSEQIPELPIGAGFVRGREGAVCIQGVA
jgi:undecaprenyl phosphate-alpha-L-ara4FN deformylase